MALADIIAQLESGGGLYNGLQPASMVNPTYGQYSGFVNQYGSGAAGINNYAAQTLAANPNATIGDFYAGYVLGTGTPGAYNFSQLQQQYPSYAANFINNSGVSPSTPLSDISTGSTSSSPLGIDTSIPDPYANPTSFSIAPSGSGYSTGLLASGGQGLTDPFAYFTNANSDLTNSVSLSPDIAASGSDTQSIGQNLTDPFGLGQGTGGVQSSVPGAGGSTNATSFWSALLSNIENFAARGGIVLLGIVLIAAAAATFAFSEKKVHFFGK